jgi:hypothetical protein
MKEYIIKIQLSNNRLLYIVISKKYLHTLCSDEVLFNSFIDYIKYKSMDIPMDKHISILHF